MLIHPWLDERNIITNRMEADAAYRAREATAALGPDYVTGQLNEAQRLGGDRMAQDVAQQLQAEAFVVRDMQRRQAEATYYARPARTTSTTAKPAATSSHQARSSDSKPAVTPRPAATPTALTARPPADNILNRPDIARLLNPPISTRGDLSIDDDPFWKEGGYFEIFLWISMGVMIGFGLVWIFITITR